MPEIQDVLSRIKRPGLLVRAARHALAGYDRDRFLCRILHTDTTPPPFSAVYKLVEMEQELNSRRIAKDAAYNPRQHIDLLCALMNEVPLLRASLRKPRQTVGGRQTNASATADFLRAI